MTYLDKRFSHVKWDKLFRKVMNDKLPVLVVP